MGINLIGGDMLLPISKEQINSVVQLGTDSYERLELLGDSILRQIITDYLFVRYREMQEGSITKLRSQIENGSSLAEMTRRIGLQKYVLLSRNHEVIKARDKNEKVQCDILEKYIIYPSHQHNAQIIIIICYVCIFLMILFDVHLSSYSIGYVISQQFLLDN